MNRIRYGLRIPYDLNTWLILEARQKGVSKNAYILKVLFEWKENYHAEEKKGQRKS